MNDIAGILQQYWGFSDFRPLQADIIQSVLEGRDTLALLPTGGGKSLCFQVPALAQEGVCVVVSPLISLMQDQVQNLKKKGISAAAVYSGMHFSDIDRVLENAAQGHYKFLYLSPERLQTALAQERLKRMNVCLLAVDEAHCISQWGYDFRPSYLKIAEIRHIFVQNKQKVPILALTATATSDVVLDMVEKLAFPKNDHRIFQQSFQRQNLGYLVRHSDNKEQKMLEIVQRTNGSVIVYVRSRRRCKELANLLNKNNISADFYHAGLSAEERIERQMAWVNDKIKVIVATNAFGMGIDKPSVRSVVHLDLPDSLEAYFQEAGRAGRDGKRAYAVLLYNAQDKIQLDRQFQEAFPDMKEIRRVYQALGSYYQLAVGGGEGTTYSFDLLNFCQRFNLDGVLTHNCLKVLDQEEWISLSESFFTPSSLQILATREQLYDYQLKKPLMDKLIKGILRAMSGVMNEQVAFNETNLARFLQTGVMDLERLLALMHQDGVIDFRPRSDRPQLTFLRDRVDAPHLTINQNLYQFRKKRQAYRIQKAVEYAEIEMCRSQQLLRYFGEMEAAPCGECDVCKEANKNTLSNADYQKLKPKILLLLKTEALNIREIADAFRIGQQTQVIKTVQQMYEEKILACDEKGVYRALSIA